ncbi:DUF4269 domain-containing protein [Bacteroides sp. 224]|uniref:DUF4269 domain-containing protein n=1 Tax=Bacteroides sp. 224 TaxID=2302936 RepID=UPI0013D51E50|nr:DUF4269 domain-containing protein [Bacteroides sp. 224]NDV65102.1 DUF4269 domain-containing protein [Bacteroides sp. 224]
MNTLFDNIEYLKKGTKRQQQAYLVLTENSVLPKLNSFHPILVGTIPINIDIETSDLDIICYWTQKEEFISALKKLFGKESEFKIEENQTMNAIVAGFKLHSFEIEIFGQNIPTKEQRGYRHMLVEHELLLKKGDQFRQQIIELKKQGYKTEPAFGIALGLSGDPYSELLNFEKRSND